MAKRIIETVVEYKSQPPCKTAAQMEQICCEPTDALQCCEELTEIWHGLTAQELLEKYHPDLDALGRDSSGRYVLVELAPRKNPCGEKIIEYDVSGGNCCDEIVALAIDEDLTPDVLPAGVSIVVYATGGVAPYTFTTSAVKTFFANNKKTILTDNPFVRLYSTASFCGSTDVKVADGCSTANKVIRSSLGTWSLINYDCTVPGITASEHDYPVHTGYSGKYKQVEDITPMTDNLGGIHCDTNVEHWDYTVSSANCIEPPCDVNGCTYLLRNRDPGETLGDPCMDFSASTEDIFPNHNPILCYWVSGSFVAYARNPGTAFYSCRELDGPGGGDGSTGTYDLHWIRSNWIRTYEWGCS